MKQANKISLELFFITFISFILIMGCSKDEALPELSQQEIIETQLQAIIDEKVGTDANKLVGVSVSIRVDGEELWNLQGGLSKLNSPVTSDMRFGIGSITKTVVAATVMKLVDEGTVNLEDTINDWLTLNLTTVDGTITIQQLLSHFTGLGTYFSADLWNRVENNLNSTIPPLEITTYIVDPVNIPGVTHQYSNSNYLILGLIIEAATGKTVGEVMREKFWTPLALNAMYFGANENIGGPMATPWRDNNGDGMLEDITNDYGAAFHSVFYCAADVFSTASDLSMWAQHLFDGDALTINSRQLMMTSYFNIPHPTFIGYGLGVRKNVYAGRTMWGHTGGMRGYGSHMFYDPTSKISMVALNNQSRSEDGPLLRHELFEEMMAVLVKYY